MEEGHGDLSCEERVGYNREGGMREITTVLLLMYFYCMKGGREEGHIIISHRTSSQLTSKAHTGIPQKLQPQ
jgi:hypothetical protein